MRTMGYFVKWVLAFGLGFSPNVQATQLPDYIRTFEKSENALLKGHSVAQLAEQLKHMIPLEQLLYAAPKIMRHMDYRMPKATFKGTSLSFYAEGQVHVLEFPQHISEGLRLNGQLIEFQTLSDFDQTVMRIEQILAKRQNASWNFEGLLLPKAHALSVGTGLAVGLGLLAVAIGYFAYKGINVKVDGKTKHNVDVKGGTRHNVNTNHSLDIGNNITGIITGSH